MRQTSTSALRVGFVRQNWELVAAMLSILVLTTAYLLTARSVTMRASSPLNHGIGIIGFLLMVATETLYSWRKTKRYARWGRTQTWLATHIYTGIVGPYMVLLHTGFRFAGLAGITFWMTFLVVCSGFVGRYIYGTIPRTLTGDELGADELAVAIHDVETQLRAWLSVHAAELTALTGAVIGMPVASRGQGLGALLSRRRAERRYRRRWQQAVHRLAPPLREQAQTLGSLIDRRHALQRQAIAVAPSRRLLAIWHTAHVPLAVAMFTAVLVHVVAALYFS